MGHSLKVLRANFSRYWDVFYNYLLQGIYYGAVPAIILYGNPYFLQFDIGLFSKPYSPLVIALWGAITGKEEEPDYYGMPNQGGVPGYY